MCENLVYLEGRRKPTQRRKVTGSRDMGANSIVRLIVSCNKRPLLHPACVALRGAFNLHD